MEDFLCSAVCCVLILSKHGQATAHEGMHSFLELNWNSNPYTFAFMGCSSHTCRKSQICKKKPHHGANTIKQCTPIYANDIILSNVTSAKQAVPHEDRSSQTASDDYEYACVVHTPSSPHGQDRMGVSAEQEAADEAVYVNCETLNPHYENSQVLSRIESADSNIYHLAGAIKDL